MIFKANNTGAYISINGNKTNIQNLTGQQTISDGVVIINKAEAIYIPNAIEDLKQIIDLLIELIPKLTAVSLQPNPSWATESVVYITKLNAMKEALK